MLLTGKVALVTGIGGVIGQAIAMRFAAEGATVIGCDMDPESAASTVHRAAEAGAEISSMHPVDLTDYAQAARYIQTAANHHGRIDVLVNAAATAPRFSDIGVTHDQAPWQPTIAGEVDMVFLTCQVAWPHLVAGGGASIINFASVEPNHDGHHLAKVAHCARKGAVLSMTRQLAIEGRPHRIRANTIAPGLAKWPSTNVPLANSSASHAGNSAVGWCDVPDDIASCAVYLASDESVVVSGSIIATGSTVTVT
jgi:NAD(P)-dependent dehydrogenase (short-subunit alcohol dehydrogenase family)